MSAAIDRRGWFGVVAASCGVSSVGLPVSRPLSDPDLAEIQRRFQRLAKRQKRIEYRFSPVVVATSG